LPDTLILVQNNKIIRKKWGDDEVDHQALYHQHATGLLLLWGSSILRKQCTWFIKSTISLHRRILQSHICKQRSS
jgi:hypothetical protein